MYKSQVYPNEKDPNYYYKYRSEDQDQTFSLASLMQFWNNSRICSFPRHGSSAAGGTEVVGKAGLRRMAAALAARAWARSSLSSLEPIKNGLFVGEKGALCFGFGLRVSAIFAVMVQILGEEREEGFRARAKWILKLCCFPPPKFELWVRKYQIILFTFHNDEFNSKRNVYFFLKSNITYLMTQV